MVTVADLLGVGSLRLVPVWVPSPDTTVEWVATGELADPSPFLDGGEVLLTTGLATSSWRLRDWRAYVAHLVEAGIAGLGLGTGLTHRSVPVALVKACHEASLNLFEVPAETTFPAVTRAASRLIEHDQDLVARRTAIMQRRLIESALRDDDGRALLSCLASLVSGGACTIHRDGHIEHGPFGPAAEVLDRDQLVAEVRRIQPGGLRASVNLSATSGSTLVQPLGLQGRPARYLAVHTPARSSEAERSAISAAVALLSMQAEQRNNRLNTQRRLRARGLGLLLNGELRTATEVLAAGGVVGSLSRQVRVLCAAGPPERIDDALTALEDGNFTVSARIDGDLWLVVAANEAPTAVEILIRAGLRSGVGVAGSVDRLPQARTTAKRALDQTSEVVPLVEWDDIIHADALALIDEDRAIAFADSFLAPLRALPDWAELVTTLRSFLRCHGSHGGVAADLGIHRNTVRNRVQRMETTLELSLNDPETRVKAWLALQATALPAAAEEP